MFLFCISGVINNGRQLLARLFSQIKNWSYFSWHFCGLIVGWFGILVALKISRYVPILGPTGISLTHILRRTAKE